MARYVLVRPARLDLETVAARTGLHPELLRRFAALGLVESTPDANGRPCFPPSTVARLARIQRLRTTLSVNYAAIGLVLDLLDRIDVLEARVRSHRRWT
ncbi:MerR HTH family regulatory protein [Amycolatopsis pretoriensis]|uniref:MerR HTH family regulatory protein n=1 Tax=Amycolatopsis pretoriensis TaxID=218821 RepID=A0A1H5QEL1_9PSEU|nr:chaperone modulator CbpM [Amycolatopsis pretoriensis]SEF24550.1 MerR HTH family regulatory protein [Amycolatopsis pretoriensis]